MAANLRRAFLVVTPLALAVVFWFHPPGGEDGVYEGVRHDADAWTFVHTTFLFFTPLMALAVFLLLRGLHGRAATLSRVSLVFFLAFYTAYEVTVGLGNGVLASNTPTACRPPNRPSSPTRSSTTTRTTSSATRSRFRSPPACWAGWSPWWRPRWPCGAPEPAGS